MSETTLAAPSTQTPNLNKALSQLQGALPKVTKSSEGKIEGQSKSTGKFYSYTYKYADLSDVFAAVGPLLAKHGLAFHSAPMRDPADRRDMILRWTLLHESGEERSGDWYLGPANTPPQTLGSAITYARRYCLSAATGIVAEDDDDGQRAQQDHSSRQSAGDVFDQSAPAPSRQSGSSRQREKPSQPAQPEAPAPDGTASADTGDIDIDAQAYADEAHDADSLKDIEGIHQRAREAGKLNALVRNPSASSDGKPGKLALYLEWKRGQIRKAGTGPSTGITANPDNDDPEWVAAFVVRLAETNDETGIATRRAEIVRAMSQQTISAGTANELIADTNKRKAAMTGEPVAA